MIELSDWLQQNWLEFGTLLAQAAILIVLIWYGRKVVKTLAGSRPEEEPALERISVPRQLVPLPDRPVIAEEEKQNTPGIAQRLVHWLQQPTRRQHTSPSAWRRLARWLQAPVGS